MHATMLSLVVALNQKMIPPLHEVVGYAFGNVKGHFVLSYRLWAQGVSWYYQHLITGAGMPNIFQYMGEPHTSTFVPSNYQ